MDDGLTDALFRAFERMNGPDQVYAAFPKHNGVPKLFLHESEWAYFEKNGFDMAYFERTTPMISAGRD